MMTNQLNNFNKLYKRNYSLLKRSCIYNNYTPEDIYEVASYCYFIYKVFDAEDQDKALRRHFRKEVAKDNSFGCAIKTNAQLDRVVSKLENDYLEKEADVVDNYNDIINQLLINNIKEMIGEEDYNFCIYYLENGHKKTAVKYNYSQGWVRQKYMNIINRIKATNISLK